MNCEQVEERLSAYLDNMLAPDERVEVTIHLQACRRCMVLLAELRQNDILLAQLPRVGPSLALRNRLFSSPEVLALIEAEGSPPPLNDAFPLANFQPFMPPPPPSLDVREPQSHPHIAVLPGGYSSRSGNQAVPTTPVVQLPFTLPPVPPVPDDQHAHPSQRPKRWLAPFKIAIAAILIVALCTAGMLSLSLRRQSSSANLAGAITPPAGPSTGQAIPLAAGSRFVFLRNGALWSALADSGGHQPERLTPTNVNVASGWVVSPVQEHHHAGDMLAYVDLQSARLHTIRSDGQQDTPVGPPLLTLHSATAWQSASGQAILNSLAWSPDSSTLAFAAEQDGSQQTRLYLFSMDTGAVHEIAANLAGNQARPTWSPDGARLAFTLASNGVVSVLDYSVQSQAFFDLSNLAGARGTSANDVLTLGWFSRAGQLAVTWCLGSVGDINSVWIHYIGANGTVYPQQLLSGDYLEAFYSPASADQTGGWLLVASVVGQAGDIWRLDLTAGGQFVRLSQGRQINFARWSPDGSTVFYLDGVSDGVGNGHLINLLTGVDQLLPDQVALSPAPDWSADSQHFAYSTGTRIDIVSTLNVGQPVQPRLIGQATALSWSPAADQLIVSVDSPVSGLYLVDGEQHLLHQLAQFTVDSEIQWTEIP